MLLFTEVIEKMLQLKKLQNQFLLSVIPPKKELACEMLYNKHRPVIFGTICTMVEDKRIAEEIFIDVFLKLIDKTISIKMGTGLLPYILKFTYSYTIEELKVDKINPKKNQYL